MTNPGEFIQLALPVIDCASDFCFECLWKSKFIAIQEMTNKCKNSSAGIKVLKERHLRTMRHDKFIDSCN
jgi:hypothetical protein